MRNCRLNCVSCQKYDETPLFVLVKKFSFVKEVYKTLSVKLYTLVVFEKKIAKIIKFKHFFDKISEEKHFSKNVKRKKYLF